MSDDPFDTFSKLAFRVEALPSYVDGDGSSNELETFRLTGTVAPDHNQEWRRMVSEAGARGAKVARLRVVSRPPSEYERFEIVAGYNAGALAGEEIRITSEGVSIPFDFWAYDDEVIEVMNYDDAGRFQGSIVRAQTDTDRRLIAEMLAVFERATPLADFELP